MLKLDDFPAKELLIDLSTPEKWDEFQEIRVEALQQATQIHRSREATVISLRPKLSHKSSNRAEEKLAKEKYEKLWVIPNLHYLIFTKLWESRNDKERI